MLSDNEIIKALEHCSAGDTWCDDCPYENLCTTDTDITKFALDLINRQKANVEGLTNAVKYLNEQLSSAKAEAVKEVIQKLKEKAEIVSGGDYGFVYEITEDNIDNLVKEMVGEG